MVNPWGTGPDPFAGAVTQRDFFLPLQNEYYLDAGLRSRYQYQWTLSIERQIADDIVVEIAYVGNRSLHLANGNANNNQFGRVTSTSGPRRIQIQLRYSF